MGRTRVAAMALRGVGLIAVRGGVLAVVPTPAKNLVLALKQSRDTLGLLVGSRAGRIIAKLSLFIGLVVGLALFLLNRLAD